MLFLPKKLDIVEDFKVKFVYIYSKFRASHDYKN